jgi:hypothetical protein
MGIFSFLTPKGPTSGGQVSFAQTAGSAGAANALMQGSQAGGNTARATDSRNQLASDDKEWLRYLSSAIRTHRKPGLTLKDEYERWLKARSRG